VKKEEGGIDRGEEGLLHVHAGAPPAQAADGQVIHVRELEEERDGLVAHHLVDCGWASVRLGGW
jgi:hypothetical protein